MNIYIIIGLPASVYILVRCYRLLQRYLINKYAGYPQF